MGYVALDLMLGNVPISKTYLKCNLGSGPSISLRLLFILGETYDTQSDAVNSGHSSINEYPSTDRLPSQTSSPGTYLSPYA